MSLTGLLFHIGTFRDKIKQYEEKYAHGRLREGPGVELAADMNGGLDLAGSPLLSSRNSGLGGGRYRFTNGKNFPHIGKLENLPDRFGGSGNDDRYGAF